jgi:integrase
MPGKLPDNIRARKDGRFEGRVVLEYLDGTKRRKSYYGNTKDDVREQMRIALGQRRNFEPKNITLKNFLCEVYLPTIKPLADLARQTKPRVRYSTYELREDAIKNHVLETVVANRTFSAHKLDDISPQLLRQFFTKIAAQGVGGRMQQVVYETLRHALNYAVESEYIDSSAIQHVKKPAHRAKETVILDERHFAAFLQALDENPHRALFLLCCTTAVRQGEILGLRWSAVNLKAGTIKVVTQIARVAKGVRGPAAPKTDAGLREITLVPEVAQALRDHHRAQGKASEWCFPAKGGKPLHKDFFRPKVFYPLLTKAGCPQVTFHSMRHLVATMLAEEETNPQALKQMLGHADYRTTSNIYTHATKRMQQHMTEKMGNVLSRVRVGSKMGSEIDE